MRRLLQGFVLAATLGLAAPSSAQPLVDTAWLKANLERPGVVVLDLTGRAPEEFAKGHVPGAVLTDYATSGWRVTIGGVPGMLPPAGDLEKLIGAHGIDNASHVVLVALGAAALDMGTATRIYWTFKVAGHDRVSILDGGWRDWARTDPKTKQRLNPVANGEALPQAKTFKVALRHDMLVTADDVEKARKGQVSLVDNRPSDFFLGVTTSGATTRPGTIPGAKNVQDAFITRNNGGNFRTREQLVALYRSLDVPTEGEQITFCNTGHWASLGWFAAHEILGNKSVKLYDGSMAEWSRRGDLPVERKLVVD